MVEAKHEFIDDYPYLVYTNEDTLVYSNKTNTSIDDISGGDTDFAIAHVNIKNNSTHAAEFSCPVINTFDELATSFTLQTTKEIDMGIIMYKESGRADLKIDNGYEYTLVNIATTDGVTWNSESEAFEISGDGTITFTDA